MLEEYYKAILKSVHTYPLPPNGFDIMSANYSSNLFPSLNYATPYNRLWHHQLYPQTLKFFHVLIG